MFILGLTGERQVGKSTIADYLVEHHGFVRLHPFNVGKEMLVTYFVYHGIDEDTARRMVYGDLRDVPCDILPNKAAPRLFMENFGHFMGTTMGPQWTLGMEMRRLDRLDPYATKIVIESVVYEAPELRRRGGWLVRVERDDKEQVDAPHTTAFQSTLQTHRVWRNNFADKETLYRFVDNELALMEVIDSKH